MRSASCSLSWPMQSALCLHYKFAMRLSASCPPRQLLDRRQSTIVDSIDNRQQRQQRQWSTVVDSIDSRQHRQIDSDRQHASMHVTEKHYDSYDSSRQDHRQCYDSCHSCHSDSSYGSNRQHYDSSRQYRQYRQPGLKVGRRCLEGVKARAVCERDRVELDGRTRCM